jgi:hypothetical protein
MELCIEIYWCRFLKGTELHIIFLDHLLVHYLLIIHEVLD